MHKKNKPYYTAFEDELPAMFAKLPTGGQYHARYAWYMVAVKLLTATGLAFMVHGLKSTTVTILATLANALIGASLSQDIIRVGTCIYSCRARFLNYRIAHDAWSSYLHKYNLSLHVSWYPKHEHVSLRRHPGRNDYLYLELVIGPHKPFVYIVKDKLPF